MDKEKNTLIDDDMSKKIVEAAEEIVMVEGTHSLNVRKILYKLGITNRVFYNRFRNIDEVLEIVYKNKVEVVREVIMPEFDSEQDFFEYVMNVVVNSLIISYDTKMQFNQYFFESDSVSKTNYDWWTDKIKNLIDYAKEKKYIKDVDSETLSYSIWCFCRGYNADAVGRNLPKDEAVKKFRYSFGFLLEGLKNEK